MGQVVTVEIEGVRESREGTEMIVRIPGHNLADTFLTKRIRDGELRYNDGRSITNEQRKKAYATIRDMAEWTGYPPEIMKEIMKYEFMIRTGEEYFSLSNCSVDLAREFISMLIEFSLEHGIQLSDLAINRTDDIGRYLYYCIKHKRCAVCGRKGEIHHVDTIGMGNDRRRVDDREYRKICLCREHHTEAHKIGISEFEAKHKVYGIVVKEVDSGEKQ